MGSEVVDQDIFIFIGKYGISFLPTNHEVFRVVLFISEVSIGHDRGKLKGE